MNLEPLYGLRLRTPRLELRLPTETELLELYELAAGGIHPAEEMPFAVPWTDDLTCESFLAHHHELRDAWSPDLWGLALGTWERGRLVGTQGLYGERIAGELVAGTGSWLGRGRQGRGIGTEMRAAVVELAFARLGAAAVTSSAFEDNAASRRVSEKLGYRTVGRETLSPRGIPMTHLRLRLERGAWSGPPGFQLEVEGLDECRPLFGVA